MQALIIFHRTSATFKPDAPIYYAFVGQQDTLDDVIKALESMRFHAPTFRSVAEAISYLNLRVGSTYLRQARQRPDTNQLETLHISRKFKDYIQADDPPPDGSEFPSGGVLRVENVDTQQRMLLFPRDELYIGRQESGHAKPDMDLSMWGAFHKGVSREHARIIRSDTEILLVDCGSTNGTWRNGHRLPAHKAEPLCDGDEVTFGSLTVRMFFQQTIETM